MSKRVSVVEPPSHDSIPEASELPSPRRSHSNPDHHPQRSPKPARTAQPPAISTASKPSPTKSSVPPSPARQRVSKQIPNPRIPQQSLDAAAQLLLASRPSDLSRRPVPVPGPEDHQIGGPSSSPITPERRPRLTTEIPPSARAGASASASTTASATNVPPLPRRTATAPALSLDNRTRPRRHTNASTKDISISNPILDHGQPIPFFSHAGLYPSFQNPRCHKEHESLQEPGYQTHPNSGFPSPYQTTQHWVSLHLYLHPPCLWQVWFRHSTVLVITICFLEALSRIFSNSKWKILQNAISPPTARAFSSGAGYPWNSL